MARRSRPIDTDGTDDVFEAPAEEAPQAALPDPYPTRAPVTELPSREPLLTVDRWATRRIQDRLVRAFLHRELASRSRTRRQLRAEWDAEFEAFTAAERR